MIFTSVHVLNDTCTWCTCITACIILHVNIHVYFEATLIIACVYHKHTNTHTHMYMYIDSI